MLLSASEADERKQGPVARLRPIFYEITHRFQFEVLLRFSEALAGR